MEVDMEKEVDNVQKLSEPIDVWDEFRDGEGNPIFASPRIEEKFIEAGWTKEDARIEGVREVHLINNLSKYATRNTDMAWFAKNDNNGTCFLALIGNSSTPSKRMQPINTYCDGFRFRSRLEARWYMAFKTWNANLVYEPEGYDLGDGVLYLPDFLIHDVIIISHPQEGMDPGDYPEDWGDPFSPKDVYFEVKGNMTKRDSEKIHRFWKAGEKILVVGNIPNGSTFKEVLTNTEDQYFNAFYKNERDYSWDCSWRCEGHRLAEPFEAALCGIDSHVLMPCMLKYPKECFGLVDTWCDEGLEYVDVERTLEGYNIARQARFEHGEHGFVR